MDYSISVSEDRKYIFLKIKGDINKEAAMKQNKEAHLLGRKEGINKYLVDMRESRNTDTITEQYEFAYKDMHQADEIDNRALVVIVTAEGDTSHDFIETVTRNSGMKVRMFKSMDEALEYID